jgi:hypothetical protein
MNGIVARFALLTACFACAVLLAQKDPVVSGAQELPVTLQQDLVAGKTPVGARVEARLTLATLLHGKVVPDGAVFSGVVVESAAKSAGKPSRLSVRMESVRWKDGSAPVNAYLTAWYYPAQMNLDDDLNDPQPSFGANRQAKRMGNSVPNPSERYPGHSQANFPPGVKSTTADHRVMMKDVTSVRDRDAGLALSSTRSNIKFNKTTTYVLEAGDLTAGK